MPIVLYDTLTRCKREFQPIDEGCVKIYVCGPTVYAPPHIGNARPAVVFDVLVRLLRRNYPNVKYVRNITDVDDKILAASLESGKKPEEIARIYTDVYHEDMDQLGVVRPNIEPKVTDNMDAIISMIARLLDEGHAYEAEGHVLFDVTSYESYGNLSKRNREEMIAGARVEKAPYKRDPADFVLWKPSTSEQIGWESAWGRGRPGWHIECSAMIKEHLGETIDIHGGGNDLIFPHHENECAQSFCAHQKPLANYWMHNGFVNMEDEKMSKSVGNILTGDKLLVKDSNIRTPPENLGKERGEVARYTLLTAHYRSPLNWNRELRVQSRLNLNTLYNAAGRARRFDEPADVDASLADEEVVKALEDDLNTPVALQVLSRLAKEIRTVNDDSTRRHLGDVLVASGKMMGLLQINVGKWFPIHTLKVDDPGFRDEVERGIIDRMEARKLEDYETADRIRDELASLGIILEDKADGTTEWSIGQKVETE